MRWKFCFLEAQTRGGERETERDRERQRETERKTGEQRKSKKERSTNPLSPAASVIVSGR